MCPESWPAFHTSLCSPESGHFPCTWCLNPRSSSPPLSPHPTPDPYGSGSRAHHPLSSSPYLPACCLCITLCLDPAGLLWLLQCLSRSPPEYKLAFSSGPHNDSMLFPWLALSATALHTAPPHTLCPRPLHFLHKRFPGCLPLLVHSGMVSLGPEQG